MTRWPWWWLAVVAVACRTTPEGPQGQGGAQFRQVAAAPVQLPAEAIYEVCWPPEATPDHRVRLVFEGAGGIAFSAEAGASNSTARCMREIAAAYPWAEPPKGTVTLSPPSREPSAWGALAWVKLLSSSRYGVERGELDPAPLVAACLSQGAGVRPGTRFEINHAGQAPLHVVPGATTDSERCIEAVLGATAWPSTRTLTLGFDDGAKGAPPPAPASAVAAYYAPAGDTLTPLDPMRIKESLGMQQAGVVACWNEALARRSNIGGPRAVRFRVDASGAVSAAWISSALDAPGDPAADLRLDRCLLEVLRSARFDLGPGDGSYTWVFASRG